ncbi:MAG: hypothetical protein B6A08_04850 [Sorangiineae bacterium NIC37A_2]|jgi:tetratricopeptide (TPR) repeat protein|nr:MAG: hypothetical protein B6A08_04850 [Sorangiineae bacterium NIC37A_2]
MPSSFGAARAARARGARGPLRSEEGNFVMMGALVGISVADRFQLEELVGHGAEGAVYRGLDLETQESVAVKIFNQSSSEAHLLSRIDHPGIVKLIASGTLPGSELEYMVLEWLGGHSLRTEHSLDPLSLSKVTALGILVARTLAALHEAGIVHRDIKPENIILRRPASHDPLCTELGADPIVIDFGIASFEPTDRIAGTPAYLSPEQARGERDIDARSDVYSLGATLFELLAGAPPHFGPSAVATLAKTATTQAPRLSLLRPGIPRRLDDLIDAMLRTKREERPSAAEVAERLAACRTSDFVSISNYPESSSNPAGPASLTRLVTILVATGLSDQARALSMLREKGAIATPLGSDAAVGHWGAVRATGDEAKIAMLISLSLAEAGAAVGIATGRARLVGDLNQLQPVGEVVDRAASLAREAQSGQVLVDSTSSELGRGRYEFRLREDGSAYLGPPNRFATKRSGGAPFVGREAELARIIDSYDRATSEKHSLVVLINGPPGIGKSRLQREVVARLSGRPDAPRVVVQRNDAYGQRHVLGAALDVLRGVLRLGKGADAEEAFQAIVERVGPETLSEVSNESQKLLSQLLGNEPLGGSMSAHALRDALWIAMTDVVTKVLSNEPISLIIEDLQWADAESILWLDHLTGRDTNRTLLLLACVRPAYFQEHQARFAGRAVVRIDLRPVSKQASGAIVRSILGPDANEETVAQIVQRSGGSPLFAEELARLSAQGLKTPEAPTIEAAIQASLDHLSPDIRSALSKLSVLGLAIWEGAFRVLGIDDPAPVLDTLISQEILVAQESSRFPLEKEYLFKHALIRDVAYSELPAPERTRLHALAGKWLAELGEDAATVAGHLDLGGQPDKAASYWELASKRALSANALRDALWMAERALAFSENRAETFRRAGLLDEAWSRLDPRAAERESAVKAMEQSADTPIDVLRARGARARYEDARGGGPEVGKQLEAVEADAEALADWTELDRIRAAIAARAAFAGDLGLAERKVKELLDADRPHAHGAQVDAFQTLAVIRQAQGSVSAALEARKNAAQAARRAGLKEREAILTTNLGFALSILGAKQEAREALEKGMALADSIGSPAATRHAQMNLLGFSAVYGSDRRLDALLAEPRAEADSRASERFTFLDRGNIGMLYYRGVELLAGDSPSSWTRARTLLSRAAERYRALAHNDVLPVALGNWAEAERRLGALDAAMELAEEAAQWVDKGAPSLLNEAPIYLTLHKIYLDQGAQDAAEQALVRALEPLKRRFLALAGSPYARTFLTGLPENAELVTAIDALGLLPPEIHAALTG